VAAHPAIELRIQYKNNINKYVMRSQFVNKKKLFEEYISNLMDTKLKVSGQKKGTKKIQDENIVYSDISCENLLVYNYNLSQLKNIAGFYKLKKGGNKNELLTRIYSYLYFSSCIKKVQKWVRGFIVRKYISLHGPACKNKTLCTNEYDFVTMEPLTEIDFHQFISYKDKDGFIYGFDIASLHNLIIKSPDTRRIKNPYNRNNMPKNISSKLRMLLRYANILKIDVRVSFENPLNTVNDEKSTELRTVSLFQTIDALGNYSNPEWFLSLNRKQLFSFMRHLMDIWHYRAQLTTETKRNICRPNGNPFEQYDNAQMVRELNITIIRNKILQVLENLVTTGINNDYKSLGAYYILGSLTLVNNNAAEALSWLYQSFATI
jgi:hypothetical protein